MSYAWKQREQHMLEMVAVLDLLRKLTKNHKNHVRRFIVLVDNQVTPKCPDDGPNVGQGTSVTPTSSLRCVIGCRAARVLWLG